jgi:hypothetical protein
MKIIWRRVESGPKIILVAMETHMFSSSTATGLRDTDMDPIQDWCVANRCGVRTSFDTFKFRNERELTIFLLKWG